MCQGEENRQSNLWKKAPEETQKIRIVLPLSYNDHQRQQSSQINFSHLKSNFSCAENFFRSFSSLSRSNRLCSFRNAISVSAPSSLSGGADESKQKEEVNQFSQFSQKNSIKAEKKARWGRLSARLRNEIENNNKPQHELNHFSAKTFFYSNPFPTCHSCQLHAVRAKCCCRVVIFVFPFLRSV